jgi:hypothetical protein
MLMELIILLVALAFFILLSVAISYVALIVYADRIIREVDPDPQPLLGVVAPKKED